MLTTNAGEKMNRQQAFEAIYAKQHDVPAESLVQYRHKSKEGYNLPGIASHYRTYCEVMDSEEIQTLRKDAERYRYWRSHTESFSLKASENLDLAKRNDIFIDAAMTKGDQP